LSKKDKKRQDKRQESKLLEIRSYTDRDIFQLSSKIDFVVLLQAWHQSIRGAGSFVGCHVALWFSVAIIRRFHLHICDP